MEANKRFQILSLDGGGIKGLFSAAILAHFEEDLGIKITDHFDLIAGTSTGGIIALGLGLGLRPKRLSSSILHMGLRFFLKFFMVNVTMFIVFLKILSFANIILKLLRKR